MNITQITVSYGATQSLPEYSNVKPSLTLTATLDDGDVCEVVEAELWAHAKAAVHEQIDLALEASGQAAKYSAEPRYQVMRTVDSAYSYARRGLPELPKIVAILPNETKLDNRFVHTGYSESRKLRYAHALRVAVDTAHDLGAVLIDCADGDLARLWALLPAEQVAELKAVPIPSEAIEYAAANPDESEYESDGDEDENESDDEDEDL